MVSVSIGEYPPRTGLHHELHGLEDRHPEAGDAARVPQHPTVLLQVVALRPLVPLAHLPQLDRFVCEEMYIVPKLCVKTYDSLLVITVCGQKEVCWIFPFQPSNFVYFLLYF